MSSKGHMMVPKGSWKSDELSLKEAEGQMDDGPPPAR